MTKIYSILSILAFTLVALTTTAPADAANKADKAVKKAQAAQLKAKKKQYKETQRPQLNQNIQQASRQLKQAKNKVEALKKDVKNAQQERDKFFRYSAGAEKALRSQSKRLEEAKRKSNSNPTEKNIKQVTKMQDLYNNAETNFRDGPLKRFKEAKGRLGTAKAKLNAAQTDRDNRVQELSNATVAKLNAKKKSRTLDAPNAQGPQNNEYGVLPGPRVFNANAYDAVPESSSMRQIYGPSPVAQQNYESTSAALQ